jgi:putative ABC transport system ATP-binding protein
MSDYAVRALDVVKHYEDGAVQALRGVTLEVKAGESVAIVGPSGSGKTTLLHLLGALDLPTGGVVEIMGQDLRQVRDLDLLRGRTLGFVFQLHNLIPNLTLAENVALPAVPRIFSRRTRRTLAAALLEQVGLGHRIDFSPVKCSGGERQRAAIARALINDPKILLSDEPTGSVDTETGAKILDLYEELAKRRGMTTITITHNLEVAERADRVVRMKDGLLTEVPREQRAAK